MPSVLQVNGFNFYIYQGDGEHGTAHVHVRKAGVECSFWLESLTVRRNYEMTSRDIRAAREIAAANIDLLNREWRERNA